MSGRTGWTGGGGAQRPPTVAAIVFVVVVVILVDDGSSGVGADDRNPMPHATKGRTVEDVMTVIVQFPLLSAPPCNPFPSSLLLYLPSLSSSLSSLYLSSLLLSLNRHSPSYSPPPPPPPPARHHPRSNASANPSGSLGMYNVRPLVCMQDADCKVSRIISRQWSHSNNHLPCHRHHCRCCCRHPSSSFLPPPLSL